MPELNEGGTMSTDSTSSAVLRVGVFFDGTANNQFNSELGRARKAAGLWSEENSSYSTDLTNVARLQRLYPTQVSGDRIVASIYVGGVGTRNAKPDTRVPDQLLGRGSSGVLAKVAEAHQALEQLLLQLAAPHREVGSIQLLLDIFGFSRGAAAARHFVNSLGTLQSLHKALACSRQRSTHLTHRVTFIGLFDTVAAMGGLEDGLDITDEDNRGVDLFLPPGCAAQVIHLTARDEHRRNFALNRVAPQWPLEFSLPGSHADLGGGYWPQVTEKVFLTRPRGSWVSPSTPADQTLAWQETAAQLQSWQLKDLLDPRDPEGQLKVQTWLGRSDDNKMQRTLAAVSMRRRVYGHLSRIYLRLMHALACEEGVPLLPWPDTPDFSLPDELVPIADKLARFVRTGICALDAEDERLLRQRYIHCSAHWNPAIGEGDCVLDKVFVHAPHPRGRSAYWQRA